MNKFLALIALSASSLLVVACSSPDVAGACQNYIDAIDACATEAGGIDTGLADTYCDDTFGDATDQESADYLNCLADAYEAGDCTDGTSFAMIDTSACVLN